MNEAVLIRELATALAFFGLTRRYGRRHIGKDMELCGYGAMRRDGIQTACSPRCARVAALLGQAADALGVEVEALYEAATKIPKPRPARQQTDLFA